MSVALSAYQITVRCQIHASATLLHTPSAITARNEGCRNIEDGQEWQRILCPPRSVTIDSEVNDGT
jgi:hypothetical protein